jgi:lipoate-protein ligase B
MTSHGFALNVAPDLANFRHIVPCGIPDKPVTSLQQMGQVPERGRLVDLLTRRLAEKFGLDTAGAAPEEIWRLLERGKE